MASVITLRFFSGNVSAELPKGNWSCKTLVSQRLVLLNIFLEELIIM